MKNAATALLLLVASLAQAQSGYEIRVTLQPYKNQFVYLGHYYGKASAVIDSVRLNEKGEGVFKGPKKLGGGIYLIGDPSRARAFEFLVDKNQRFAIQATSPQLTSIRFLNAPENTAFLDYQNYMAQKGKEIDSLQQLRSGGLAPQDSAAVTARLVRLNAEVNRYRQDVMAKDPSGLLTTLLKAMREPEVPGNPNPSDSLFAWRFFKSHFWEGVNFWDDRLIRTPFFDARIDKYYDQLVYPAADSVIKELDWMLGYASASPEMQQYLLIKFINRYLNQKFMWEDAVFVHLFEKYINNKTYAWLNDRNRKLITDRAYSLMANIFGSPAAEISLPDPKGEPKNLYGLEAPFTLVAIWDPTCGHCKEVLPRLDSLYRSKWQAEGLKIYALAKETDGTKADWLSFIEHNKIGDWVHVYYSKEADKARTGSGIPSYSQLYDVQSFPTLYLLDSEKRIIAKKLSYEQVDEILALKLKKK